MSLHEWKIKHCKNLGLQLRSSVVLIIINLWNTGCLVSGQNSSCSDTVDLLTEFHSAYLISLGILTGNDLCCSCPDMKGLLCRCHTVIWRNSIKYYFLTILRVKIHILIKIITVFIDFRGINWPTFISSRCFFSIFTINFSYPSICSLWKQA